MVIGDDEQVGIHLAGEGKGQVFQVSMREFRRYWSLLGYELMGPAPRLFKDELVRARVRRQVQLGLSEQ